MKKLILVLALSLLALPITYNLLPTPSAYAEIPHLLSYQGRLTDPDGNPKPDGSYSISFRIYDAAEGGNLLWQDSYSVTLSNGIFDVLLGSRTNSLNIAFDKPYYLAIQVGSDPEMTPRQEITSVGYAYKAETAATATNSDTVDGIHASTTPEANKLLALDSSGKLPVSAMNLKVYDSGWFAVSAGSSYTKIHNLGTQKVLWKLYFATDTAGSNMDEVIIAHPCFGTEHRGGQLQNITTTQLTVVTAVHKVHDKYAVGSYASGYYRIIGLVLE